MRGNLKLIPILLAVFSILIISLGCIQIPFLNKPSPKPVKPQMPSYVSTSDFTSSIIPSQAASFLKYGVISYGQQVTDIMNIPLRDIPFSLDGVEVITVNNWVKGESYPLTIIAKIEIPNAPSDLSISCNINKNVLVGPNQNSLSNNQLSCGPKGNSCEGKYVEPLVIEDSINTNADYIEVLYYADCTLTNVPIYRYVVITKDRNILKALPRSIDIITAKVRNILGNKFYFPTGIGVLRFQLYVMQDYLANQYGVDGSIFWYVKDKKSKPIYLRIGNLMKKDDFAGFGVYFSKNNPIKIECDAKFIPDSGQEVPLLPTGKSKNNVSIDKAISYNCRQFASKSDYCKALKDNENNKIVLQISNSNEVFLKETSSQFFPIFSGSVNIRDLSSLSFNRYGIILINCIYNYSVRIPLVRVKITTIKEE